MVRSSAVADEFDQAVRLADGLGAAQRGEGELGHAHRDAALLSRASVMPTLAISGMVKMQSGTAR